MLSLRTGTTLRVRWETACILFVFCAAAAIHAPAQTFTTLGSLSATNGYGSYSELVQGIDGNFYGNTFQGGANSNSKICEGGCGVLFKVTPTGTLTTLYNFCSQANCTDGANPQAALVLVTDSNFYGSTANGGGVQAGGTLFKVTPGGTLTTILELSRNASTRSPMTLSTYAGTLFGATFGGGTSHAGTFFKGSAGGGFSGLYTFTCSASTTCPHGKGPTGAIPEGFDGKFYGVTQWGGTTPFCNPANFCGTVFNITATGVPTILYNFCNKTFCPDGQSPVGLVLGTDAFYGTTVFGGVGSNCSDPTIGCGTVFRITPTGTFTSLYSFCQLTNCADGNGPNQLIQGTDGNFYGTTLQGGVGVGNGNINGNGTIFRITPTGTLTILHSFCTETSCSDGGFTYAGLVQGTDGKFYGITANGGANGDGTIFSLDVGLAPFVKAMLNSGIVGSNVAILGNNLTGTTAVGFNGTAAAFTVVSDTEITATVPAGATTGHITVTTPSATLASNVPFRVTPQVLSFSPPNGPVGTSVTINGESLTAANAVAFGRVLATGFTVNSNTQITATVPSGAKTGVIAVRTAGGSGQSGSSFTVMP